MAFSGRALITVVILVLGLTGSNHAQLGPSVSEALLLELPATASPIRFVVSPNQRRVVFLYAEKFNPNTGAEYFLGRALITRDGEQPFVFEFDDKPMDPCCVNRLDTGAGFSPDSRRVAIIGRKTRQNAGVIIFVDGDVKGPHKNIRDVTFSPDSRRLAYTITDDDNKDWVVVDDKRYGPYDSVGQGYYVNTAGVAVAAGLSFSPDSERILYAARQGRERRVFIDGTPIPGKPYDDVTALVFSADGRRVVYRAQSGKHYFVVVDNSEEGPYDWVGLPVALSGDGGHLAYAARSGKRLNVIVDGKALGPYDDVFHIHFSPVGNRLAFAAKAANKWRVVVDGNDSPLFDSVIAEHNVFSPDGRRVAFGAKSGKDWWVLVDGSRQGPYQEVKPVTLRSGRAWSLLQFSPDSSQVAYVARLGKEWHVVRDGRQGRGFTNIVDLTFSPDSRHLVYRVVVGPIYRVLEKGFERKDYALGAWEFLVDEQEPTSKSPGSGWLTNLAVTFDSDAQFRYLAIRKEAVYLITQSLK
jgi:WD40 repeat protein